MTSIHYNQNQNNTRQFGKEITNISNNNNDIYTPGNPAQNLNANTGKDQQEILKQMHKQKSTAYLPQKENNHPLQQYNTIQTNPTNNPSKYFDQKHYQNNNFKQNNNFNTNNNYGKNENLGNFDMSIFERELKLIEQNDQKIPENVSQYATEIFLYLRNIEKLHKVSGAGIQKQHEITPDMRCILINWLIEVHKKFNMIPETFFVAVGLIDKFLDKNQVTRQKLQLLGITALFIAGKYEEIYPPNLKSYVDITDRSYTKYDILDMEGKILLSLNFNLTFPSSLRFVDRYTRLIKSSQNEYFFVRYLIELAMLYDFTKYDQSLIASASIYLTNKIFNKKYCWPSLIEHAAQYTEQQIRPIAKELLNIFQQVPNSKYKAVRDKFLSKKYNEIARTVLQTK